MLHIFLPISKFISIIEFSIITFTKSAALNINKFYVHMLLSIYFSISTYKKLNTDNTG